MLPATGGCFETARKLAEMPVSSGEWRDPASHLYEEGGVPVRRAPALTQAPWAVVRGDALSLRGNRPPRVCVCPDGTDAGQAGSAFAAPSEARPACVPADPQIVLKYLVSDTPTPQSV